MNWSNNSFKMYSFSDTRQRLTGKKIHFILKRCSQCYRLTNSGGNIYTSQQISVLRLNKVSKSVYFINTHQHWILLSVFPTHQCLVIDPLNIVRSWPDVMSAITLFSNNNNLQLYFFDQKFQRNNSQICGYLCLWATLKVSQLSFLNAFRLRHVISSNGISRNERAMMYAVYKHFHLNT